MSGGRFNYINNTLKNEIFDWQDRPINVFEDREISELVFDVLDLVHDFDLYTCGDTCEETWLNKKNDFKEKWFENRDKLVKTIIDNAINELKEELYKTFERGK